MSSIAELEISLRHRLGDTYEVDMRYWPRDSDAEERPLKDPLELEFDRVKLRGLRNDPTEYGNCLTGMLFPQEPQAVANAFNLVRASAGDAELRVRLYLDPNALALHEFRWESLRDLANDAPLFTSEKLWCSRYLSSSDWRSVKPRSKGKLRALVAIASPADTAGYETLEPVKSEDELARAKKALGSDIHVEALVDHKATLTNIIARLREGFDILYLVCHGTLKKGSWLWLEADDESGRAVRVSGNEFATRVRELAQRPYLAILASCESAGLGGGEARTADNDGVLASLGPSLAEAGVAAVVAMNGSVTMKTVEEFMPVFFKELQSDGCLDRAMAIARGQCASGRISGCRCYFRDCAAGAYGTIPASVWREASGPSTNGVPCSAPSGTVNARPSWGRGFLSPSLAVRENWPSAGQRRLTFRWHDMRARICRRWRSLCL
jgi:hypothetical protein